MSTEAIARRYSTALADVVIAGGDIDTVKSELAVWGQMIADNAELQSVFGNPAIAHDSKEKVLNALISKSSPSRTTSNFLKVLLQNGRLGELVEINERFVSVLEERGGRVSADIVSARDLPGDERAEFERNLESLTGKKVSVNYTVDPTIIGGVVTRIGSTVYDASVKTKLQNLREQLISG